VAGDGSQSFMIHFGVNCRCHGAPVAQNLTDLWQRSAGTEHLRRRRMPQTMSTK
jgi:hypothetical protein